MASSVLIADDCSTVRHVIRMILERDPEIRVIREAASADEIWRVMAQEPIDVVTLDMHMPGMSGPMLIRSLKDQSTSGIIVVSGSHNYDALELGVDACFNKDDLIARHEAFVRIVIDAGRKAQLH